MRRKEIVETPALVGVLNAADIGGVIRSRRKDLGYTQERLSVLMGMSPRLLGEIEHGKQTTGIQKIMDLVRALDIECIFAVRERW